MRDFAFKLYIVFLISFFLHLTARVPVLGLIRFDLLLVLIITVIIIASKNEHKKALRDSGGTGKYLKYLIIFMLITLPLVEYPGSVLRVGAAGFIKAVIFFYFTIALVNTEKKLAFIVYVILACQILRVFEPLFLNITEGYWGDATYIGGGEFAARLSGAPSDIINPNELGYVIVVSIILLYYLLLTRSSLLIKLVVLAVMGACMYALVLTASRSAFLVLMGAILMVFWSSKYKSLFIVLSVMGAFVAFANLSEFQRDRYLSIFSSDTKGGSSAQGRIDALFSELEVVIDRPIIGHGLSTSGEAKYYVIGSSQISHNLYLETAIELGMAGLIIYLLFLKSIIVNLKAVRDRRQSNPSGASFTEAFTRALFVWAVVTFVFSFAQYGLSIYVNYLIAGLAVVLTNDFEADEGVVLHKNRIPRS